MLVHQRLWLIARSDIFTPNSHVHSTGCSNDLSQHIRLQIKKHRAHIRNCIVHLYTHVHVCTHNIDEYIDEYMYLIELEHEVIDVVVEVE